MSEEERPLPEIGDPIPAVEEPKVAPANVRFGYGHTNAQHGVHLEAPKKRDYQCADCRDLEARITEAFKRMGFEF